MLNVVRGTIEHYQGFWSKMEYKKSTIININIFLQHEYSTSDTESTFQKHNCLVGIISLI